MKITRLDALKLVANQLDFLNGRFHGLRVNFTELELKSADVILTTLEQAGIINISEVSNENQRSDKDSTSIHGSGGRCGFGDGYGT